MIRILSVILVVGLTWLSAVEEFPTFAVPSTTRALVDLPPNALRARGVDLHLKALEAGQRATRGTEAPRSVIAVEFFPEARLVLDVARDPKAPGTVYTGTLVGGTGFATVSIVEDACFVSVLVPGQGRFQIRPTAQGHVALEVDASKGLPCACSADHPPGHHEIPPLVPRGKPDFRGAKATTSTIDLLVLYTTAAKNAAGSKAGVEAMINTGVAITNVAMANSQVDTVFRLVYQEETTYTERGIENDLNGITIKNDGNMDQVHSLRDQYGADLVMLLTGAYERGIVGIAWLMLENDLSYEAYGFSVTDVSFLDPAFPHELGHNMGGGHEYRIDPGRAGMHSYSHGHRFEGDDRSEYITIMSYTTGRDIYIPHFSNPSVNYAGQPTGIAEGSPNPCDNARTFRQSNPTVARYRDAKDWSVVEFADSVYRTGEESGTLTMEVKRSGVVGSAITVDYTITPGSASNEDYTGANGSLTWGAGDAGSKSLAVTILQDNLAEGEETFVVNLTVPDGQEVILGGVKSATGAISDDDGPQIEFVQATTRVVEGSPSVDVKVKRTRSNNGAVGATVTPTATGLAVADADFDGTPIVVSWADGESQEKTVSVPIGEDDEFETLETFTLRLGSPTGLASIGTVSEHEVTIIDNDVAIVTFEDLVFTVDEQVGSFQVAVSRTGSPLGRATVVVATQDGATVGSIDPAIGDTDFAALPRSGPTAKTLTWEEGDTATQFVTITVLDDVIPETLEAFSLTLVEPGPATLISKGVVVVNIRDNDELMANARYEHTANLVTPTTLVVAGGRDAMQVPTASSERYNLVTGRWVTEPSMSVARAGHGSAVLQDRVLVAGGRGTAGPLASAELWTATDGWTITGTMTTARADFALVTLTDGRLLAVGGRDEAGNYLATCESYNPVTGLWTADVAMPLAVADHQATRLVDGRVVVTGGQTTGNVANGTAQLYDPATRTWQTAGVALARRYGHRAVVMQDGRVLVAGGRTEIATDALNTEIWNPSSRQFVAADRMEFEHGVGAQLTRLTDGRILAFGGSGPAGFGITGMASTEVYIPEADVWQRVGDLATPRTFGTAQVFEDVVVHIGGQDGSGAASNSVEHYRMRSAGLIGFETSVVQAQEGEAKVTVRLNRLGGTTGTVSVAYATSGLTAISGTDFESQASTVVWSDGAFDAKTITITLRNDGIPESPEAFMIVLANVTGGATLHPAKSNVAVVINDEPNGITSSINDSTSIKKDDSGCGLGSGLAVVMGSVALVAIRRRRR